MLRTLTYRILSATDGQTILHYLKSLGYSGPILVHLKKTDHGTLLNGVWAHMNETLHTGDLLCLHLEENTSVWDCCGPIEGARSQENGC